MLKKVFLFIVISVFFAYLIDGELYAQALKPSPARECAICHFRWMPPFYYEQRGTPLYPLQIEKVAGSEMMCFSCHDGSTEDSRVKVWLRDRHKVNVKPSNKVRIPKIFPLVDGKIVCTTCHSAHGVPTDKSIERVIFLRISNKNSIMCELCHVRQTKKGCNHPIHTGKKPIPKKLVEAGAVLAEENPRHVICESCHTAHGGIEKNFILRVSNSDLCITCHTEKGIESSPKLARRRNHPINVKFDPRIHLYHGQKDTVQCASCHIVHQPDASKPPYKLLAAPINRSQVCLICHADKGKKLKNHPINVVFKDRKKCPRFFFGPAQSVQCLTCHGIHMKESHPKSLVMERDPLCKTCHGKAFAVIKTDHDLRVTAPGEKNILGQSVKEAGVCSACHIPHNAAGPKLWARKLEKKDVEVTDLCLTCHSKGQVAEKKTVGKYSHPVRVAMKEEPKGLPLYKKGNKELLECATCHNPHQWKPGAKQGPGKNVEGTVKTSFLREPAGPEPILCSACHRDAIWVEKTDHDLRVTAPGEKNILGQSVKEAGVCSACHIPHNAAGPKLWARKLEKKDVEVTDLCLTCHSKGQVAEKKTVGKYSHPVRVAMKEEPKGLPLYKKGNKELLECATCHNPHQWKPGAKKKGRGKNLEGTEANSFLRIANLKHPELCARCHKNKAYVEGTDHDMHVVAPKYVNLQGKPIKETSVCTACHGVHNANQEVVLWVAPLGKGQDYMEKTCYGCHSKEGPAADKTVPVGSHPMKLYFGYHKRFLSILKLDQIPLYTVDGRRSKEGVISCPTCHDPHIWDDTHPTQAPWKNVEGDIRNSFLRKRAHLMENFCSVCHGPSALFLFRYYHDKEMRDDLHKHKIPLILRVE